MTREPLEYTWAIDPAVSRLAFAYAPMDGGPIVVNTLWTGTVVDGDHGNRLGLLDRQVRIYARQAAGDYPPAVVWVEQPSGRFRNLNLTYAVGVIQAALSETLAVPVWTIPSSTWKQRTVGAGNASKQQVAAWVRDRTTDTTSQDEADAFCMAAAGRAMLTTGQWKAKAA